MNPTHLDRERRTTHDYCIASTASRLAEPSRGVIGCQLKFAADMLPIRIQGASNRVLPLTLVFDASVS